MDKRNKKTHTWSGDDEKALVHLTNELDRKIAQTTDIETREMLKSSRWDIISGKLSRKKGFGVPVSDKACRMRFLMIKRRQALRNNPNQDVQLEEIKSGLTNQIKQLLEARDVINNQMDACKTLLVGCDNQIDTCKKLLVGCYTQTDEERVSV